MCEEIRAVLRDHHHHRVLPDAAELDRIAAVPGVVDVTGPRARR